jgi:hypothetical protein
MRRENKSSAAVIHYRPPVIDDRLLLQSRHAPIPQGMQIFAPTLLAVGQYIAPFLSMPQREFHARPVILYSIGLLNRCAPPFVSKEQCQHLSTGKAGGYVDAQRERR